MLIRKYNSATDESQLMKMIKDEDGWDYADEGTAEAYKVALQSSITYVACEGDVLCGYSRSLNDNGLYIFICDLLVMPTFRGKDTGRKLMEILYRDYSVQAVYVLSDVDEYYEKIHYKRAGSIFEVPNNYQSV